MSRKKTEYTEQELTRQTKYIIVIGGDTGSASAIAKSIAESKELLLANPRKKVIIFSRENLDLDYKKIAPSMVQTFNPDQTRLIAANIDADNDYVIQLATKGLKNGLFIIGQDLANAKAAKHLLEVEGKGQDYVLHRTKLGFLKPELEYIRNELSQANLAIDKNERYIPNKRIMLRIHADKDFGFGKEQLLKMFESIGQEHGFNLYMSFYLAYRRARRVTSYCKAICASKGQLFEDFINPVLYKQEVDQFIYYDWFSKQILGVPEKELEEATHEVANMLKE